MSGERAAKRYTARRLVLATGEWESAEFDDYEEARRFLADYPVTSLQLNVPVPSSAVRRALSR